MRLLPLRWFVLLCLAGLFALADGRPAPRCVRPMPDTDPATWPDEPRGQSRPDRGHGRDPREDPSRNARSRAPSRQPRPVCPNACTTPTGR